MVLKSLVNSEDYFVNTTLKTLFVKNQLLKVIGSLMPRILILIQQTILVNVILRMDGSMMKPLMMEDVSIVTPYILIVLNVVLLVLVI